MGNGQMCLAWIRSINGVWEKAIVIIIIIIIKIKKKRGRKEAIQGGGHKGSPFAVNPTYNWDMSVGVLVLVASQDQLSSLRSPLHSLLLLLITPLPPSFSDAAAASQLGQFPIFIPIPPLPPTTPTTYRNPLKSVDYSYPKKSQLQ